MVYVIFASPIPSPPVPMAHSYLFAANPECMSMFVLVAGNISQQGSVQFRENFARACFEALLQFSFIHSKDASLGRYT